MELKIVSCSDYGYETKTDTSYSELFSLEGCLLSVTLHCDSWETRRDQILSCPSASHNILLCVAQAEIQSAGKTDQSLEEQLCSERYRVSPGRYPLCLLCEQTKQQLF